MLPPAPQAYKEVEGSDLQEKVMATERVNRIYEILREGDKAQQRGAYEEAREAFAGAREEFHRADHREGVSEATCRLGYLAMAQERWEDALSYFGAALQDSPGNVDALIGRSEVYGHLGRYEEEKADIDRAVSLSPSNPQVRRRVEIFNLTDRNGVKDLEADQQKGISASTPSQFQLWLVAINQYQFDWDSSDPTIKYSIQWNYSIDAEARENMKRARLGDVVLVYRPEANHDSIAGIGQIKREINPDPPLSTLGSVVGVEIELEIIFEHPVSRDQLVAIVPVAPYKPGTHIGLFTPIDAEKWSFIRALIQSNNPSLSLEKWPAPSDVSRISRADLLEIAFSDDLAPGKTVLVDLSIRNHSNFTWRKGDLFLISGSADWQKPGHRYQGQIEWRAVIETDVPVWSVWVASNLELFIPEFYEERLDLSLNLGFLPPYAEGEVQWVSRQIPGRLKANELPDETPGEQTKEIQPVESSSEIARQLPGDLTDQPHPQQTPPTTEQVGASVGQTSANQTEPLPAQLRRPLSPTLESKSESPVSNAIQQSSASAPEVIPRTAPLAPLDLSPQAAIMLQRYEPLPDEIKINITVAPEFVTLEYNDQEFNSPNRINQTLLLELESEGRLREYGEELFNAIINDEDTLIGGKGKTTFRGYFAAISDGEARGKTRVGISLDQAALKGTTGTDLFDIWWEYLKDPKSDVPLSVIEKAPFYRLQGKRKIPDAVDALPLKILVAICNPVTLGQAGSEVEKLVRLNIEQECDIIERSLKRLKDAGLADYDIWSIANGGEPVTLLNLQHRLEDGYHVLHLISHGAYSRKLGGYCLVMEDDQREHLLVTAEDFKSPLLTEHLRLVVLACCQSGDYSTGKALQALGPRLVHLGAPAVIAMQDFVQIPAAQLFTQHFYDDLARSGRVDMAMAATRFALYSRYRGESRQWAIPVLLMCNDDGKLFNVDRGKAAQLEELRPDVRTYNQLPGGDPTANKLARVFETEARNQRMDEKTVSLLREAVSAVLRGQTLRPESEPLAPQQDRQALSEIIKRKVRINPAELRHFVETSGNRLELPASVYQQVASALNNGKHVIFIGPPGTGKTSLANDICRFAKKEGFTTGVRPTTATADWSAFDTVGGYVPTPDQTLQFRPGVFLRAICEAEWLVIDEINRAEIDKAFGELFTVLSGQGVDLPYWIGAKQVRILPAEKDFDQWWDAGLGAKSYDYVTHPNWRIVAAMNAYDKSSLYSLSFAFMRRFAFIDIDAPDVDGYHALLEGWVNEFDPPLGEVEREPLIAALRKLVARESELMRRRALGPAILRDIIKHIGDRRVHDDQADLRDLLCEAFLLHAAPQLDGIERSGIFGIYRYLQELFAEQKAPREAVAARIRSLYPHITEKEWTDGQN
ncbi:MAG TPA: CHAT domain-containing protein [Blastocatellia bacterium]|nr:CHAT domain-containing protein [Blastocatellia bacterium]